MVVGPESIQILGGFLSLLSIAGILIAWYIDHPEERYEEKVEDLQDDRWSKVTSELGELCDTVQEESDYPDNHEEDITRAAAYGLYIHQDYSRGDLDELENQIEAVDRPRELFETCRKCYGRIFIAFALAIVFAFAMMISMAFTEQFESLIFVGGITLALSTVNMLFGLYKASVWWRATQRLDEMWEDYNFM